jgi:hypothetical protein
VEGLQQSVVEAHDDRAFPIALRLKPLAGSRCAGASARADESSPQRRGA